MKFKHIATALVLPLALLVCSQKVQAKEIIGNDVAKYQFSYASPSKRNHVDEFSMVQIGGSYGGTYINNPYYNVQVNYAKQHHMRVHTYMWYGVGGSTQLGKQVIRHYIKRVKTPKNSIVALDYELGASGSREANTSAILAGMKLVKQHGYTPMLYSYGWYLQGYADLGRINAKYPHSLWIAGYPIAGLLNYPYLAYRPTLTGTAIWQFTSAHANGGLDGNIDFTGITKRGYSATKIKKSKPKYFIVTDVYRKWQVRLITGNNRWSSHYVSYGSRWKVYGQKKLKGMQCYLIGKSLYIPVKYVHK